MKRRPFVKIFLSPLLQKNKNDVLYVLTIKDDSKRSCFMPKWRNWQTR